MSGIKQVEMEDVGPFSGKHKITFKAGLNLIVGNNGTGKTILLRALANTASPGGSAEQLRLTPPYTFQMEFSEGKALLQEEIQTCVMPPKHYRAWQCWTERQVNLPTVLGPVDLADCPPALTGYSPGSRHPSFPSLDELRRLWENPSVPLDVPGGMPSLKELLGEEQFMIKREGWAAGEIILFRLARLVQLAYLYGTDSLLIDDFFTRLDSYKIPLACGILRRMPCQVILASTRPIEGLVANVIRLESDGENGTRVRP